MEFLVCHLSSMGPNSKITLLSNTFQILTHLTSDLLQLNSSPTSFVLHNPHSLCSPQPPTTFCIKRVTSTAKNSQLSWCKPRNGKGSCKYDQKGLQNRLEFDSQQDETLGKFHVSTCLITTITCIYIALHNGGARGCVRGDSKRGRRERS